MAVFNGASLGGGQSEGRSALEASIVVVDRAADDLADSIDCQLEVGLAASTEAVRGVVQASEDFLDAFVSEEDVACLAGLARIGHLLDAA